MLDGRFASSLAALAATLIQPVRLVLGASTLAVLVFLLWPGIDILVSRLFYDPAIGFVWQGSQALTISRVVVWRASNALFLLSLASFLYLLVKGGTVAGIPAKLWSFIFMLYLLGPGLLVDFIVKPLWSRPRPHHLSIFGGEMEFATLFEPIGNCLSNCSFVSGEVSGAAVLAISLTLLLNARAKSISRRVRFVAIGAIWLLPVVAGLQRIAAGRHFLSDAIFAVLFHIMLALLLHELVKGNWWRRISAPFTAEWKVLPEQGPIRVPVSQGNDPP